MDSPKIRRVVHRGVTRDLARAVIPRQNPRIATVDAGLGPGPRSAAVALPIAARGQARQVAIVARGLPKGAHTGRYSLKLAAFRWQHRFALLKRDPEDRP